jgi:hypothetical protein
MSGVMKTRGKDERLFVNGETNKEFGMEWNEWL